MKKFPLPKSPEVRILLAGLLMALLLGGAIGYYMVTDPAMSRTLGLAFLAHSFGGRAAGIGLCIMNDLSTLLTVLYNFYLEVLIVCWTYALFVLSINNYIKLRGLRLFALRLERKARKYKDKLADYGWVGLFLFVMLPLPATGPVIGSIVGYLLRFKAWRNFSATFLGTLAAIVLWTVFFDFLEQNLHVIRFVFGGIIAIVGLSYVVTIKNWLTK